MISIVGLQKTTVIDYPGKVACTVFLPNCDFRCPFCHNPSLINSVSSLPVISEDEFFSFVDSRKGWLEGVCITGGEPLLSSGLYEFIKMIKAKGLLVKLDTNGSLPKLLKRLIDAKLLDYLAMDIKASPERYSEAAGVRVNLTDIQESINLIRSSGVPYEFRTTVLPRLHSRDDFIKIGEWLDGSDLYSLQQFRNGEVLDPSYKDERAYSEADLKEFAKLLKPYFKKVVLRV
ncbi:MAG: anaerobic ribonucleoside-triphosphate reductase activating protein [Candidatus Nanoarchaeia archaeon]|jgi:pyruvate formate lyase activating enzyme